MLSLRLRVCLVLLAGFSREPGNFPGIPWGTPFSQVRQAHGLEQRSGEGNVERYLYDLDHLGEAKIHDCWFEFTGGRFSGIILTTDGPANTHALHDYLSKTFGKGSDDGHRFWQWLSEETYVSLDEDSAGDGYVLWYGIHWQGK